MKWLKFVLGALFLASILIVGPSGCGGGGETTKIEDFDKPVEPEGHEEEAEQFEESQADTAKPNVDG